MLRRLAALQEGNDQFLCQARGNRGRVQPRVPSVGIVCCSELRRSVEELFSAEPGDLFVAQCLGGATSASTVASVVFAAASLHIRLFVMLGHTDCVGARREGSSGARDDAGQAALAGGLGTDLMARVGVLRNALSEFPDAAVVPAWLESGSGRVRFL